MNKFINPEEVESISLPEGTASRSERPSCPRKGSVFLGFSDWGSFLKNAHLTAALVDRLTENSHVFNMKECIGLREPIKPDHDPDPKKG